jgi:hypothetical protein
MSLFAQFETSAEKEIEGVEITYGPNEDGSIPTFILSRMGQANKAYTKALNAATKPYARQIKLGTLADETSDDLFIRVFVKTVLRGWKNVYSKDGTLLPYSSANAIALLKALPDLYDDLSEKAQSAALFREETNEDDAKN